MDMFQYGVFKLGQIWTVADQGGARLGFPDREQAIAALQTMIAVHRASGSSVAVTLQDNAGRLRTLSNPANDLGRAVGLHESAWSTLMDLDMPDHPAGVGRRASTGDG
jgi:hypothetical protein